MERDSYMVDEMLYKFEQGLVMDELVDNLTVIVATSGVATIEATEAAASAKIEIN